MEMLEDHLNIGQENILMMQIGVSNKIRHKANETQEWLSIECPDFISRYEWLLNSPDLNPMDDFV
jgi:hypothetical protein